MKRTLFFLAIVLSALWAQDLNRKVRSIKFSSESLSSTAISEIQDAWRKDNVRLEVENPFDIKSLKKAEDSIRAVYRTKGQKVKVTHEIAEIPPRSLEINFRIVQLD